MYNHFAGISSVQASFKLNGNYGYIDKTCKIVIEFKFLDARSFLDGLALVMIQN